MHQVSRAVLGFVFVFMAANAGSNEKLFQDPENFDSDWPPLMLEVSIPSHGEMLTGTFYAAAGEGPHPTIVTLHAFPGYENSVTSGYEDAASAVSFVTDTKNAAKLRIDRNNIILLGHSYGAVAALDVGATNPDVRCVISLAPEDMTLMVGTAEDRKGLARYTDNLRVVSGYSGQQLVDDLLANGKEWAMTTTVKSLGNKPYLLIGGGLDSNFDSSEVSRLLAAGEAAGASAITAMVIENGDHSFSAKRVELTLEVAVWLENNCH